MCSDFICFLSTAHKKLPTFCISLLWTGKDSGLAWACFLLLDVHLMAITHLFELCHPHNSSLLVSCPCNAGRNVKTIRFLRNKVLVSLFMIWFTAQAQLPLDNACWELHSQAHAGPSMQPGTSLHMRILGFKQNSSSKQSWHESLPLAGSCHGWLRVNSGQGYMPENMAFAKIPCQFSVLAY